MTRLARWTATLSMIALGACTELPSEVPATTGTTDGSSGSVASLPGTNATDATNATPPPASGTSTTAGSTADSTTSPVSGVDTTATTTGTGPTTTADDSTTATPASCDGVLCPSNQVCDEADGRCVSVCEDGWGPGAYGGCLSPWGGIEITENCDDGADEATCIVWGQPIQASNCSVQNCATACDCPAPPDSGDAVVTCGEVVDDGINDCYLDCSNGEACPAGMTCRADDGFSVCVREPAPLPMYGNCGNVDASCLESQCAMFPEENPTHAMCVALCNDGVGECDASIPGSTNGAACEGVIFPPGGPDCYIPCDNDGQCPDGMDCIETDADDGDQTCIWPLE